MIEGCVDLVQTGMFGSFAFVDDRFVVEYRYYDVRYLSVVYMVEWLRTQIRYDVNI